MASGRWGVPAQPRALAPSRPNVGTLLLGAYRRFEEELFAELRRAGHGALRPKHGAVLANVDPGGTRATDLAARAGMTKASMGELVDDLGALGYVLRTGDPGDRRAKLVVLTDAGLEVARLARRTIDAIERRWAGQIGARALRALQESLDSLTVQARAARRARAPSRARVGGRGR